MEAWRTRKVDFTKARRRAIIGERRVARFDQTIVFTDLATMRAEPWPAGLRAAIANFAGLDT